MRQRHGAVPFLEEMTVFQTTEKSMLKFYEGTLRGIPAVAVYSGVCKVNAAVAEDILTGFHPWMLSIYFSADEGLLSAARRYAETAEHPILFGTIATGEQFIEDEVRERIRQKHAPLAVDMETAAAAHVCYVNGGGTEHQRYGGGQRRGGICAQLRTGR